LRTGRDFRKEKAAKNFEIDSQEGLFLQLGN
jgi:hypothetical protein